MQRGDLTSEAYVSACLARIRSREPQVQAWAAVDEAQALEQARARDREPRRSALHGIPVGFKDVIRTADLPTAFNSPIYEGFRPNEDAHSVAVLRAMGAVVLGKTQTLEFACGGRFPPTHNPWDLARTPGGSSSGSGAAVADGMVPLALGTQTGGSTIRPASFCGVFGMKPTWGRIPFDGTKSFAPHLDTIGLYGRSIDDLRLLAEAFALFDHPEPQVATDAAKLRLGVCRTPYWNEAEPAAQAAFDALLADLAKRGIALKDVELPDRFASINTWQDDVMQDGGRSAFWPEMLTRPALLHDEFKAKLNNHLGLTPARMRRALDAIAECRMAFEASLDGIDAVLSLSAPGIAPLGLQSQGMATFNRLWTAMQVPCVSVPALRGQNGLPIGLQLIHRRYEDHRLLDAVALLCTQLDTGRMPWN